MPDATVQFTEKMQEIYNDLTERAKQDHLAGKTNSQNIQLLKALDAKLDVLKWNPQSGQHVPRRNILKKTAEQFGVEDLWVLDLPSFWRLLYTITRGEIRVICLVLHMCDHDEYNTMFVNYKKSS